MRTRLLPENEARHAHGQQHILRAYRPCVRTVYNIILYIITTKNRSPITRIWNRVINYGGYKSLVRSPTLFGIQLCRHSDGPFGSSVDIQQWSVTAGVILHAAIAIFILQFC